MTEALLFLAAAGVLVALDLWLDRRRAARDARRRNQARPWRWRD